MSAHAPSAPDAPAMGGSLAEVFAAVGSSPRGLGAVEARTRLDRVGANEPGAPTHAPVLRELATNAREPPLRHPAALFQTGWFVESLATQTRVLFVIRTAASPFRSRPSAALVATTALVVAAALVLPVSPLAGSLGFVPPPWAYFAFLGAATVTYLMVVELVKRRLLPPAR